MFGSRNPEKSPLCLLIGPGRTLKLARLKKRFGALMSAELERAWISPRNQHTLFKPRYFGTSLPVLAEERILVLQRDYDDPIDLSNPPDDVSPEGVSSNGDNAELEDPIDASVVLCNAVKQTGKLPNLGTLCKLELSHDTGHRYGRDPRSRQEKKPVDLGPAPAWRYPVEEESATAELEYGIQELFARNGRTEANSSQLENRLSIIASLVVGSGLLVAAIQFFTSSEEATGGLT